MHDLESLRQEIDLVIDDGSLNVEWLKEMVVEAIYLDINPVAFIDTVEAQMREAGIEIEGWVTAIREHAQYEIQKGELIEKMIPEVGIGINKLLDEQAKKMASLIKEEKITEQMAIDVLDSVFGEFGSYDVSSSVQKALE